MGTWKYQKNNYTQVSLKLHKEYDRDIIEYLATVDNVQGCIKYLLRSVIESGC